jgi:hypothetical protein
VMKVDFMQFKKNDPVLTVESTIKHAHPAMGKSHWVMARNGKSIVLINDAEFGAGLHTLLRTLRPVENEKQERCTEKAKALLKHSVYAPKNRYRLTYLYGKDTNYETRTSSSKRPPSKR